MANSPDLAGFVLPCAPLCLGQEAKATGKKGVFPQAEKRSKLAGP